jgi:hypothetical protein
MGFNLWVGSWERNGDWQTATEKQFPDYAFDDSEQRAQTDWYVAHPSDPGADEYFKSEAISRYRRHPGAALSSWLIRYHRLWLGTRSDLFRFTPSILAPGSIGWLGMKIGLFGFNAAVLILAALGAWLCFRKYRALLLLMIPVVFNALIYVPFHNTESRYSQPVYFIVLAYAALASVAIADWFRARPARIRSLERVLEHDGP